ncbi:MAG: DNA internalization-related competence protein ComEC/Rec2 [Eubacteriales bacterium]
MRRPLSFICFVFLVAMIGITQLEINSSIVALEEGDYLFLGTLQTKQIDREQVILSLERVSIHPSNTSYDVAFSQHDTTQIPTYNMIAYCNLEEYNIEQANENTNLPKIGSTILIRGTLRTFRMATNYGEFHQESYQRSEGYDAYITSGTIVGSSSSYDKHGEWIYKIKESFANALETYLASNEAGVMKAMLLGDKSDLEDTIKYLYQKNGVIHVLAISGLHISLIGMAIYQLLKRTPIPLGVGSSITLILLSEYVYMTGSSTSGIRAVTMFGIYLFALWNRRSYDMITAMSVSYVFLLLRNPYSIYQVGFQLSFGAILAIGLFVPILEEMIPMQYFGIKEKGNVGYLFYQGFLLSAGVQIMTLPILIATYYEYPMTSIFLNLIMVPTVGLVVALGMLLICCSYVSGFLATMCGVVLESVLQCYELLCSLFLKIPGQSIPLAMLSPMQIVLYYLGIFLIIYLPKNWKFVNIIKLGILSITILLTVWTTDHEFRMIMIDVGQGDGILIQTPTNRVYMIDGGSTSNRGVGTYQILPTLKYYGIREIEAVFISHMDYDHYSGILELLELQRDTNEIWIRNVVVPCNMDEEKLAPMKELLYECGIPLHYVERGFFLEDGGVEFQVLMPYSEYRADSENENSLTMRVTYGEVDILCTGDLEKAAEVEFIRLLQAQEEFVDYEVLKVGHHGSNYATSTALLEAIRGEVALISCGRNNMYGHPHLEVIERLESASMEIYNTAEVGAIVLESDGKSYWVTTYLY